MTFSPRMAVGLAFASCLSLPTRAEDINDAWNLALRVNGQFQARQLDTVSAGLNVQVAKAARLPRLSTSASDLIISQPPYQRLFQGSQTTGSGSTGSGTAGSPSLPTTVALLGNNQTNLPFNLTTANLPLYTSGRISRSIDAARFQLNAQKTEEVRTAMDLKLTVAEAYVGVLRSRRNLDVARSDVNRLAAFLRDVKNRKQQSLATRNEELAAEVSLANAQLTEISRRRDMDTAWATYNRYLCRPPQTTADLAELAAEPSGEGLDTLTSEALRSRPEFADLNPSEAADLSAQAIKLRPELLGLAERARASDALAAATIANIKPQINLNGYYVFLGNDKLTDGNFFAAQFALNWTLFDGGATRKRAESQRVQARSLRKQRADLAADVILQVQTRFLDLNEARQRVIIASATIASAEENINVVTDRYRNGLSIYTEVLDAENRRVQSFNNYYAAVYDQALAGFRLRRAVGDL